MSTLDDVILGLRGIAQVARRRPFSGARGPGWSWKYEFLVQTIKLQMATFGTTDFGAQRRAMDAFGERSTRNSEARFEAVSAGGVGAEWVSMPRQATAARTVVLYLHGGAYVVGSPKSHRFQTSAIAEYTSARVLALDYRLAPEHPCPAALDDTVAAYRWLLEQGTASDDIVIAGASAGGGLTIAALVALRDAGCALPRSAVLLSPWMDLRADADSRRTDEGVDMLRPGGLESSAQAYAGTVARADPRVSPILAELAGLPPLLVVAGGAEHLLNDSHELAWRATQAGVEATLYVEPGEVHVFPAFHTMNPRSRAALARVARFIRGQRSR